MGEAALKEPTMEDILSSIRKIISEEGGQTDSLNLPRSENEADTQIENAAPVEEIQEDEPEAVAVEPEEVVEMEEPAAEMDAPEEPAEEDMMKEVDEIVEAMEVETPQPAAVPLSQFAAEVRAAHDLVRPAASVDEPVTDVAQVQMADATPAPEPAMKTVPVDAMDVVVEAAPTPQRSEDETEAFRGALMSPSSGGAVSGSFDRLKRSALDDVEATTEAILRPLLREWLDENLPTLVERLVREEIERVARGT